MIAHEQEWYPVQIVMKSSDGLCRACHLQQKSAIILLVSLERPREIRDHPHLPFLLLQQNAPEAVLQRCIRGEDERNSRLGKCQDRLLGQLRLQVLKRVLGPGR